MAYSNIEAIRQALLQESLSNLGGQDVKGLLAPTQTALQAGLLGGMQQLAPYTGYTTTPTTFGQSIGATLMGAASGVQKQKESDLTRALQGIELYGKLAPNLTEFQKNVKRFNEIDAIPEEKRTTSEKNEYSFLKDRLTDSSKETLSDFTLSVIKKAEDTGYESLSQVEKDAYDRWKAGDTPNAWMQSSLAAMNKPKEEGGSFFGDILSNLFSSEKEKPVEEKPVEEVTTKEQIPVDNQEIDEETISLISELSKITETQGQEAAAKVFSKLSKEQQDKILANIDLNVRL